VKQTKPVLAVCLMSEACAQRSSVILSLFHPEASTQSRSRSRSRSCGWCRRRAAHRRVSCRRRRPRGVTLTVSGLVGQETVRGRSVTVLRRQFSTVVCAAHRPHRCVLVSCIVCRVRCLGAMGALLNCDKCFSCIEGHRVHVSVVRGDGRVL
jgi:hypothetical protein